MAHTHPEPYVPAGRSVPEATFRALVLGLVLAVVMGAANTYLALYVGMTISASIPAAVISMAILRGIMRRGTILENNVAQTVASTGESLAAGAVFTLPALVLVGAWQDFRFWPTTFIVMLGGLLGVVFMVPMRRALIVERPDLKYPEGLACAEVLIVGQQGGTGVAAIAAGLGVGAVFKLLITGVTLLRGTLEGAFRAGRTLVYGGLDVSPALLAVGYIVGLNIASLVFLGGALAWLVAIPLMSGMAPDGAPLDSAWTLWDTQIRYMGVGAMLVGGLSSLVNVRKGLMGGLSALRRTGAQLAPERTMADLPLRVLGPALAVITLAMFALFTRFTESLWIGGVAALLMLVVSFLFVAVAAYICGLVGSSNSPVSGMTICALLITALVLGLAGLEGPQAMLATLGVAGVVCCAACTSGDIAQDLKTGQLVGATPKRLQGAEMLGAVLPAFIFAPVMTWLHHAYTIGSDELPAPQARLFASLTEAFFGEGELPWDMVAWGAGIGVALLVVNAVLQARGAGFRAHVMPVAVGIYLPLSLSAPILIGGLLRQFTTRRGGKATSGPGVLFGSGLIAGEALLGIALALPIGLKWLPLEVPLAGWAANTLSFLALAAVIAVYAAVARRGKGAEASGG